MCLAVPVRVLEVLSDEEAWIEQNGIKRRVNTALIESVQVGDYLILHVGYALTRLDPDEAQKTLALMDRREGADHA